MVTYQFVVLHPNRQVSSGDKQSNEPMHIPLTGARFRYRIKAFASVVKNLLPLRTNFRYQKEGRLVG